MTESSSKRKRRIAHPILVDEVHPLVAAPTQQKHERFLPLFLHNALFSDAMVVPFENCPFRSFIDLPRWTGMAKGERITVFDRETLLRDTRNVSGYKVPRL